MAGLAVEHRAPGLLTWPIPTLAKSGSLSQAIIIDPIFGADLQTRVRLPIKIFVTQIVGRIRTNVRCGAVTEDHGISTPGVALGESQGTTGTIAEAAGRWDRTTSTVGANVGAPTDARVDAEHEVAVTNVLRTDGIVIIA
jgi:hypothetical protein